MKLLFLLVCKYVYFMQSSCLWRSEEGTRPLELELGTTMPALQIQALSSARASSP